MSHFTRIKTKLVDLRFIKQAIEDLGYRCEEGAVNIRGYGGAQAAVQLRIPTGNAGYDIGFVQSGESYDLVADWYGIRDINQERLLKDITRRYAYHATRSVLEEQGFTLAQEQVGPDEQVHLVLRRMV